MDLVAALMNHPGIDLNVQDKGGNTALHHAVANNHPTIVSQLLMGKNINTSLKDCNNETALKRAIDWGRAECVKILQKHERLLKKRSPEEEGGEKSSKRRNTKTQSVIKLPFSKLKL